MSWDLLQGRKRWLISEKIKATTRRAKAVNKVLVKRRPSARRPVRVAKKEKRYPQRRSWVRRRGGKKFHPAVVTRKRMRPTTKRSKEKTILDFR